MELENKTINTSKTSKELKIGVVLSYLLIAINVISGFLLAPFIINTIGKSDYGQYTAASSLITMFIVDFGLSTAITKFISKYRVTSNQNNINKLTTVVTTCFMVLTGILLAIFTVLYFFLDSIYVSFTAEELKSFKVVYIIVASYSVISFPFSMINGVLVAYDKIFLTKIADIISKLVFIVCTVVVLLLNLGIYFLTACYAIHGLLSILLKLIFAKLKTPLKLERKFEKGEFGSIFKQVISFSLWAAINTFGRVLLISFIPSILGFTSQKDLGTAEITLFSIAAQIESYIAMFATAFGSIFYPSISRILYKDGELTDDSLKEFQKFHIKVARIQVLILFIINAGLIVLGQEFIYLWMGPGYDKTYYCMLLICIPSLFFYPLQTAENAMAAIEKIRYLAISTLISVAVGIGSSIGLSYLIGSIGACAGVCIGFVIRTVLFNWFFAKYLKLKSLYFYLKSYASFIVPTVLAIAPGIVLNVLIPSFAWLTFAAKVVSMSVFYLLFVMLIGLNKDERIRVKVFFEKTTNKIASIFRRKKQNEK